MLTLGHTKLDAAQVAPIMEKARLHSRAARQPGFAESYLHDTLPQTCLEIAATSSFFQGPEYCFLTLPGAVGGMPDDVPLMDKASLRLLADRHFNTRTKPGFFRAPTSGSTGEPLVTWFDRQYLISHFARLKFLAEEWNIEPQPYCTFEMTVSVFRHLKPRRIVQPALEYSLYERVNLNPVFWDEPARAVEYISEQAPLILHGMPSSLERLADLMAGVPAVSIRPRLLFTMAETLLPGTRNRLEEVYDAPVCDTYGLVEVGGIVAEECREQKGLHINVVDYLVEVLDDRGRRLEDGREGEIVITNLYQRPVPVLRYRTGDFGVLDCTRCPCGRLEPRIVRLAGRALTRFTDAGGRAYNPFDVFGEFLLGLPVHQFRMVQDQDLNVTLQYRADTSLEDHDNIRAMRAAAARVVCPPSVFKVVRVDSFECDGKFQAFLKEDSP